MAVTYAPENTVVLETKSLTKRFDLEGGRSLTAFENVNLQVLKGETLGIVGESGCGKSTLLRSILQLHRPTAGEVLFQGQDLLKLEGEALRQSRRQIQMVFQDPMAAFNPKMTVRDILCEPQLNFRLISKAQRDQRAAELLAMVELPPDLASRYPHSMSGGQRQRLAIARALALEPQVVLCDEATSSLDVSVQEKICRLLVRLQKELSIAYVFVCHDMALVDQLCHSTAVMYLGTVVEVLHHGQLSQRGLHPYTKALKASVFEVRCRPGERLQALKGEIPSPQDIPPGCPFQSRCAHRQEICQREKPQLRELAPGHQVACHLVK